MPPPQGQGSCSARGRTGSTRPPYTFGGTTYQLDLSEPGNRNAIHGLTRDASWQPVARTTQEVTLRHVLLGQHGYPFCLDIEARYQLYADHGLQASIGTRNAGSAAAPYGTGSHPYLAPARTRSMSGSCRCPPGLAAVRTGASRRPGHGRDRHQLRLPRRTAGRRHAAGSRASPGWPGTAAGGPGPGCAAPAPRWRSGRARLRWLQVFTGDALGPEQARRALAIEPMTCPPNAFASGWTC